MIARSFAALCLASLACLAACTTPAPDRKALDQFLSDREVCDHLRGEIPDPSDQARLKEVIDDINQYCAGTDARLKALKVQFAHDPAVMATLNAFPEHIERKRH
jgi:hypothetical protein